MLLDETPPDSEQTVAEIVAEAAAGRIPIEVSGLASKRRIGRPLQTAGRISMAELRGITLYEPGELVLSARAGTPLAEIEAVLDEHDQMLAFEPADWSRLLHDRAPTGSIGSVFAMNVSGPRRILRGAARDHLLGIRAVNGRGEIIKWGGRVMKNVTGYDLARGLCGSWGTLAILTEVTMKVLPRPPHEATLLMFGLPDEAAVAVMCAAMGSPYEVSGTVHLPAALAARAGDEEIASTGRAVTALRVENFRKSVEYRSGQLEKILSAFGDPYILQREQSARFWRDIRAFGPLSGDDQDGEQAHGPVWRLTVAPSRAAAMVGAIRNHLGGEALYDWSGGLIWLWLPPARDANAAELRRAIADFGADALLVRAPADVRSAVDVFHPQPEANMILARRLKRAFDPAGILNPGRMYRDV